MAPVPSEFTTFTLDNMGRFLCNTLQEAIDSTAVEVAGRKRGFDVVVIGGGTFGSVIAQRLFDADKTHSRRILVIENGPFVLPEHVQNMPFQGGAPDVRRPWESHPALNFAGLLFALGGRSLTWGGWSPELLHDSKNDEMVGWPQSVIDDLQADYFFESGEQIGVNTTNDFISGPLQRALRDQLLKALKGRAAKPGFNGVPFDELPNSQVVRAWTRKEQHPPLVEDLREWLSLENTDPRPITELLELMKLEAPLAVQSATEPGLFPLNKFSSLPLLIRAARQASEQALGVGVEADARKRLFVVGGCHVQDLVTETKADNWVHVTGVRLVDRNGVSKAIPLATPERGEPVVLIALGTIESTRLAKTTFQDSLSWRAASRMGKNLIVHLRSNFHIRVSRDSIENLPASTFHALQVGALFVKGRATVNGIERYFHLQITASGLGKLGDNSEAELFKKVPDLDTFDSLLKATDTQVVITLRGIGEMAPGNPESFVDLFPAAFDFDRPKAVVSIGDCKTPTGNSQQTKDDHALWNIMDVFTDEVALMFANKKAFEIINTPGGTIRVEANATAQDLAAAFPFAQRRDGLGTTHHEAGTMWMGVNDADSVTNEYGRIHDTTNCYVVGPALFPTVGSPNPMLTGVALARRTAKLLTKSVLPQPASVSVGNGFTALFDGTSDTFRKWRKVGANHFSLIDGEIVTHGNSDIALLYYAVEAFRDFVLKVQFRILDSQNHNSGIFVRFRDPLHHLPNSIRQRAEAEEGAQRLKDNPALRAVYSGFEIQIDDIARGDERKDFYGEKPEPNGLRKNRTGAVYKIPAKDFISWLGRHDEELQVYRPGPDLMPGNIFEYEITVKGQNYKAQLKNLVTGQATETTDFTNTDLIRGVAEENGEAIGHVGIQAYPGATLAFRSVQLKKLSA